MIRKCIGKLLVCITVFATASLRADTEIVDGITWTYTVLGDSVSIGGENSSSTAVPTSTSGAITIPSTLGGKTVTSIGNMAFIGCSGLTGVTIPDSVTSIGNRAFADCRGLTSVTIGTGVTNIGYWAFNDCKAIRDIAVSQYVCANKLSTIFPDAYQSITNVVIHDSVTSIGDFAFSGCRSLANLTIPKSVASIGYCAFHGCVSLSSLTIPRHVVSIGVHALAGVQSFTVDPNNANYKSMSGLLLSKSGEVLVFVQSDLMSVTIPASVTVIDDCAFFSCDKITSVIIPDSVKSIGEGAFSGCESLANVIIGNGVLNIGEYAFSECPSLESVTIGNNVTNICCCAFDGCVSLTDVTIPDSVVSIGECAFSECLSLASVTLGNGVERIGESAFCGCENLAGIIIPDSVTYIGQEAFAWCGALSSVTIGNGVKSIGGWAFLECNGLTSVTIGNGVTNIGMQAFCACDSLTNVTIGSSVTSIGAGAFNACVSLSSVTIPGSVTSIGKSAFSDCSELMNVTIPKNVTSIGDGAFTGIKSFDVDPDNVNYKSASGLLLTKTGQSLISVQGGLAKVTIPYDVTNIGEHAFAGCSSITNVTIPGRVTSIGEYAFSRCSALTSVAIPRSVTNIGVYAFWNTALDTVHVAKGDTDRIRTMISASIYEVKGITFVEDGDTSGDTGGGTSPTAEEVRQEWHHSIASPMEPTVVVVGDEEIWIRDVTNNCYYFRSANAKLSKDGLGWMLLLYGATVGGRGIQSNGDLTIELANGSANSITITKYSEQVGINLEEWSFISSDNRAVGVNVFGNLLIHGIGSLTINNLCTPGSGGFLDVQDPYGINIGDYGWYSGSLTVGFGTSLKVNTTGTDAIHVDNGGDVSIVGASVELVGGCGIYTTSAVSAKGSMLNILSMSGNCIYARGGVNLDYTFGVFVSKSGCAIASPASVSIDHSVLGALTSENVCIYGKGIKIGSGFYRLATDGASIQAAIYALDGLEIDGAEIEYCIPDGYGVYLTTKDQDSAIFNMKSGLLRHRERIDIRSEFLLNNLWSDFYGLGASYNSLNLEELVHPDVSLAAFVGYTLFDFIKSKGIGEPAGNAKYGVCGGSKVSMAMMDGTIVSDGTQNGVHVGGGIKVSGGSLKGPVLDAVTDNSGNRLICVTNAVPGVGGYQKVKSGWATNLPAWYSTDSLYSDGDGFLYFWLPSSYEVSGGSSGDDTSGGGSGGSGSDGDSGSGAGSGSSGSGGGTGGGAGTTTDLAFFVPTHYGWTAPLIVSSDPFATSPQTVFEQGEPIYLNYAFNNAGDGSAVSNFVNRFTLSNGYYWEHSWGGYVLPTDGWGWLGYNFMPDFLNTLPPGDYTLTCTLNAGGDIAELDVANNTRSVAFTVKGPDLTVSEASVHKEVITLSESVTLRWRVANVGNGSGGKSQTTLMLYDVSNGKLVNERSLGYVACDPLASGGNREYTKTITGKSLGLGVHNIAIKADGQGEVVESDETDNYKMLYIEVVADAAVWSKSNVDWQFYKKKGEADSFFLSASSDMKKKVTTFNVGQPIYMRCCLCNAKKNSVYSKMRCSIYLNGIEKIYGNVESLEKNYYWAFTDTRHDFLQNLPAGSYTLTAVLDSENAWQETNEKNNVKSISFTVVGKPTIASESTYYCAINVPVSWPVTIYGKATVKGLPSGLKYSGGAITGKATKAGTYTVTVSASNAAGATSKTLTIHVVNPGFNVSCSAQPNGASEPQNIESGAVVNMMAGVKQMLSLSAVPGMSGVEKSDVSSMSAKGLPSGLKLAGGVISGVPTKPGTYSTTITFKNKYGWTSSFDIKFVVSEIPEWAIGAFAGGCGTTWDNGARYEFTVSSAGKLSGKVFRLGETWTMSAASSSAFIASEKDEFVFDVALKSGKTTMSARLYVWDSTHDSIGVSCLVSADWNMEAYGARAVWTSGICAEAIKRANVAGKVVTIDGSEYGLTDGESVKLTFAKDGTVKANAKFVSGTKNGNPVFKTSTASTRLAPSRVVTETPGRQSVTDAQFFLYFTPPAKNTSGRFFALNISLDDAL